MLRLLLKPQNNSEVDMHEMNVIGTLAARVVKWGNQNNVKKILEINIVCGQLRMFDLDFMQRYFNIFTRGTIAEGAKLELTVRPIGYHCCACGAEYKMTSREWLNMDVNRAACIYCDSENITLTSGGEYFVSNILADVDDDNEDPSVAMTGSSLQSSRPQVSMDNEFIDSRDGARS